MNIFFHFLNVLFTKLKIPEHSFILLGIKKGKSINAFQFFASINAK